MLERRSRQPRSTLLAGVALGALTLPSLAAAQDTSIDNARTTPVVTSTTGDTTVTEDGSVTVDGGTAFTVDSDAVIVIDGDVISGGIDEDGAGDGDGAGAVFIDGTDLTLDYTHGGGLLLPDAREAVDEVPVDYADDRFGFRLGAGSSASGTIDFEQGAAVQVEGDNSVAIDFAGDFTGDVDIASSTVIVGEESAGIDVSGTIAGDVDIARSGSIEALGRNTDAINISGDIDGQLTLGSDIRVTGYLDFTPDAEEDANGNPVDNNNAEQLALTNGQALDISGSITDGVLIDGAVPPRFSDLTPATGVPLIEVRGSAPAILIDGGAEGLTLGTIFNGDIADNPIEYIVERDENGDPILDEDGDPVFVTDSEGNRIPLPSTQYGDFGFVNRGRIVVQGIYQGADATVFSAQNATIDGGIRNDNAMESQSALGDATTIALGANLSTPQLYNDGLVQALAGGAGANAYGVRIAAGADVGEIINQNEITARVISDDGQSVGILDEAGTVTRLTNTGIIQGVRSNDTTVPDTDETAPPAPIAIDFSANTAGVEIFNTVRTGFTGTRAQRAGFGLIGGRVLTGAGDDIYRADAGVTRGNISLGGGSDRLDLTQSGTVIGSVDFGTGAGDTAYLSDGAIAGEVIFAGTDPSLSVLDGSRFAGRIASVNPLAVSVSASELTVSADTDVDLTSLDILTEGENTSLFRVSISADGQQASALNVLGTATIADGTVFSTRFEGGFIDEELTYDILTAGTLDLDLDQLDTDSLEDTPFLFDRTLSIVDDATLQLNLRRKTAEEVGLPDGRRGAYVPVLSAVTADTALGSALFNATTQDEFLDSFNQVLPEPLLAPLAYARAQTATVSSLIARRVETATADRNSPRTLWAQEQSYYLESGLDEASNGFDGGGFVVASGIDVPIGSVDVVGLSVHLASARYDEQLGEDFPFSRLTYGADVYVADKIGRLLLDGRAGIALTDADSERTINIDNEFRRGAADWTATQVSAGVRARYDVGRVLGVNLTPYAGLDYLSLTEDAYEEEGDEVIALIAEEREADSLRVSGGLIFSKSYELTPSAYDTGIPGTITPRLTLGYEHDLIDDPLEATYRFIGQEADENFTLTAERDEKAAFIGTDIAYENQYTKVHGGLGATLSDETTTLTFNVGLGLKW